MFNMNMHLVYFIIFAIVLSFIGGFINIRSPYKSDFYFAGRNLSIFRLYGASFAAMVGTGSSIGALGYGYLNGWAGALYGLGGGIGIILTGYLFAHMRKYQFMSMPEEISYYYGANSIIMHITTLWDVFISLSWLAVHIMGGGLLLSTIIFYISNVSIDVHVTQAFVAFSILFILILGGFIGLVWTNIIMAIIFFTGFSLIAVFIVANEGGITEVITKAEFFESQTINYLDKGRTTFLGIKKIGVLPAISLMVSITIGVMATSAYRQFIYAAERPKAVKHAYLVCGLTYFIFSFIPALLGITAFVIARREEIELINSDRTFAYLIFKILPYSLGVFAIIVALSATISSATSAIFSGHISLLRNIIPLFKCNAPTKKYLPYISRITLAIMVFCSWLIAVAVNNNIIYYITESTAVVMSGIFVITILGKYWQKASWIGAMAALAAPVIYWLGEIIANEHNLVFFKYPIIFALILSFTCGFIFSLIFPSKRLSPRTALWVLKRARKKADLSDLPQL